MNKDVFKEFIDEHQQEFDDQLPSEQLWNKINDGLEKEKQSHKKYTMYYVIRVAAVVTVVVASYIFYTLYSKQDVQLSQQNQEANDKQAAELIEAEAYYTAQVNIRKLQVFQMVSNQPDVKQDIIRDFSELDSAYADLKSDLKENIANEQVIEAMIQNYRMRLEILEDLLVRLDKSKNNSTVRKGKTYEL